MNKAEWSRIVKEHFNYTCQICGRYGKDNKTHAHDPTDKHIDPQVGLCLCASCHKKTHNNCFINPDNVLRLQQAGLAHYEIALIYGVTVFKVLLNQRLGEAQKKLAKAGG